MTLGVFSDDDTDAPMRSLAAEMTPAGQIITLQTSTVLVGRPSAAEDLQTGEDHSATLNKPLPIR
jgi:hypothetical protein